MDHLAFAQAHNYKTPVGLPCNKQALAFDVHRYVVHVAFGRQWDGLDQPQKSRHGYHWHQWRWRRGWGLLTLRARNEDHPQSQENRQAGFHFLFLSIVIFDLHRFCPTTSPTARVSFMIPASQFMVP